MVAGTFFSRTALAATPLKTEMRPWLKKSTNLLATAQSMGLEALLEGQVRKSGERIRLAVQLANTRGGD